MAYTTEEKVASFVKHSLSADELELLPQLLVVADSWINDQIEASFNATDPAASSKKYVPDSHSKFLDIDPVKTISAVTHYSADGTTLLYDYDLNLQLEEGPRNETVKTYLRKRYGWWPEYGYIQVTGVFTLGDVPEDIVYLATYLVGKLLTKSVTGELKKEMIEGYMREFTEFKNFADDEVVTTIINKYVKNEIFI